MSAALDAGLEVNSFGQRLSFFFILSAIPVGALLAWRRRDWFAAGSAATVLGLLALILAMYTVWDYRGTRLLLMMQPMASMATP